ncbi:MAG: AAA family ATPase [Saprospiraceae bacterium]|nr:AAA family ATPase [Saprospiraceae bacterium]MCF8250924.1 AAA family ATPase [Saprospiraceae bacterium]MCF8283039.1 AAA family ATPase [Bacteroidales bacterium]MCF8311889.1 AAA family ATPase [Saprospiraceae bacterium]MCF8441897.1 AAA family ATPase [Saprospiraceae bacterium]
MDVSFKGNKEAERVINLIRHTNKSVFLTGKAGTGKSTLLRYLISCIDKKYILLAPTGIAALNIGGQTIHSFFGFGFQPYLPFDKELPNLSEKIDLLKKLDLIIIDEISMVRADIMNAIDLTLKKFLKSELPFGGKQILLVGDLLQLPPVLNNNKPEEVLIIRENYETEFFFSAKVFEQFEVDVIELQTVYRQEQKDFVKILNNIRTNQAKEADLLRVNSRHKNGYSLDNNEEIITLTTRNVKVSHINTIQLNKIDKPEFHFEAKRTGTFIAENSEKKLPTDLLLKLKEGAQIIFVKNDSEKKWVNGTIGKIVTVQADHIEVEVKGGKYSIEPVTWEDIEYKWNKEENRIEKEVVGTFTQYPIKLAWAITIHKSQGQTFEKAVVDMDTGAFASGQTYVALSRCTTLDGIILTRKITFGDIKVSQYAVRYLQEKGVDSLEKRDSLELELIETIRNLETNIEVKNKAIAEEILKTKTVEEKGEEIRKKSIEMELEFQKIKMENEYLKKEIERLKSVTWIQKLFGAK